MSIADTVKERVALTKKAYIWLKTKSVNNVRVNIGQFASAMKQRKADAEQLAIELMHTLDTADLASTYWVFVEDNQIPKWLTPALADVQRAALVSNARYRHSGIMHSHAHDKALVNQYGSSLYDVMVERYNWMSDSVVESLVKLDIDDTPAAPPNLELVLGNMKNPTWSDHHGSRTVSNQLPRGTRIDLSYSSIDFERAEALDGNKVVLVRHLPHKDPSRNPGPIVVAQYHEQTQNLIEDLRRKGLLLASTGMSWSPQTKATKTSLLFVKPDDLLSSVRITLPWDYVLFREIK